METKVITSFAHIVTAEGNRIAYTYSIIDANGNLVSQNNKGTFVVTDNDVMDAINVIRHEIDVNHLNR